MYPICKLLTMGGSDPRRNPRYVLGIRPGKNIRDQSHLVIQIKLDNFDLTWVLCIIVQASVRSKCMAEADPDEETVHLPKRYEHTYYLYDILSFPFLWNRWKTFDIVSPFFGIGENNYMVSFLGLVKPINVVSLFFNVSFIQGPVRDNNIIPLSLESVKNSFIVSLFFGIGENWIAC